MKQNRKNGNTIRFHALWIAVFLCLFAVLSEVSAADPGWAGVRRISGENRFETAFAVADVIKEQNGNRSFDTVIIASGKDFPDALTGSYLASVTGGPILMANGPDDNRLINYVKQNLSASGRIYLLGGTKALPDALESAFSGFQVTRLQGENRLETNIQILKAAGVSGGEILVCTGWDFADSLSASAVGKPILLVNNRSGVLTQFQTQFLSTLKDVTFTVIGGENAVSSGFEAQLRSYGEVRRIGGNSRFETSVLVAEAFFNDPRSVTLAYAKDFPDGLCGGQLAWQMGGPVILTMTGYESAAREYAQSRNLHDGAVLGGEARIQEESVIQILGLNPAKFASANAENRNAVFDYAARLYSENSNEDYLHCSFTWDSATRSSNWIYFTGLMYESFLETDFEAYNKEIREFFNQHIMADGTIKNYIVGELDAAMLPAVMLELLNHGELTPEEEIRYAAAANFVYRQLENQTVYPEAGNLFLHSQKADGTPRPAWEKWNICLDGIYMSQTFLIRLAEAIDRGNVQIVDISGATVTGEKLWDDIYTRLVFVMENMRDPETGLLYHGYCVETGETNKVFWSRGIGWYAMVLLEAAEKMPDPEKRQVLVDYFASLMDSLMDWQDPYSFLWYNVTDGREEYAYHKSTDTGVELIYNRPESSGSAMFAYCLLRGYHNGLLTDEAYRRAGLSAFNSLVETKMTDGQLADVYHSSSVTSNKDLYQRNGYVTNDGKGVGPFILAANYAY